MAASIGLTLASTGCGLPGEVPAEPPGEEASVPAAGPGPRRERSAPELRSPSTTATAFVQSLVDAPDAASTHVDEDFLRTYEAAGWVYAPALPTVLRRAPKHCQATWREAAGGTDVAIPPPLDTDPPDRIEYIEAARAGLADCTEVNLTCTETVLIEDCHEFGCDLLDIEQEQAIFTIAVAPDGHGSWVVRGWRDLATPEFAP